MAALLAALIMGAASGLLGAVFVDVNRRTDVLRKRFVTKNW